MLDTIYYQLLRRATEPTFEADFDDLLGHSSSPLDHPIKVTRFPNVKAQQATASTMTARELASLMLHTRASEKNRLPLLKLAIMGDVRTAAGSLRSDVNLISVSGIEGDYDSGDMSPQEAAQRLDSAGIAAIVYTTPSHRPDAPRWRVLAPLWRPVPPRERDALCAQLNGALGGVLAGESFTRSQTYFYGGIGDVAPEVITVEGGYLDRVKDIEPVGRRLKPLPIDMFDDLLGSSKPASDWGRVRNALDHIADASDRRLWLEIGQALHAEGGGSKEAFTVWCNWARKCPDKFRERDQRRTWDSFQRSGITIATLFHHAIESGWEPDPIEFDDLDALDEADASRPADLEWYGSLKPALNSPYLIKGIVDTGSLSVMWGNPKAGKTFAALDMMYHLAAGRQWRGHKTKQAAILYLALEGGNRILNRIVALQKEHSEARIPFALKRAGFDLLKSGADLKRIVGLHREVKAAAGDLPTVIVIDTLSRALAGGDESSSVDMTAFIRNVDAIREKTGAHVMIIHHAGKDVSRGMRGHSSLMGAIDHELFVSSNDETGIRTLRIGVQRDEDTTGKEYLYKLRSIIVGIDEDGDDISSAVCDPIRNGEAILPPLTDSERKVFEILKSLDGASEDTAISACMGVSASARERDRRVQTKGWLARLVEKQRVRCAGGKVLIPNSSEMQDDEIDDLGEAEDSP